MLEYLSLARLSGLVMGKHSISLQTLANYGRKFFITSAPDCFDLNVEWRFLAGEEPEHGGGHRLHRDLQREKKYEEHVLFVSNQIYY